MLRKKLIEKQSVKENNLKWRNHEVFRIEAFSDAVFAFAVTLLIVSLEVPETFDDLLGVMKGFPAFAISFAILFQVWYSQYIFFRLFGLKDTYTNILNAALLFVVLFYVYPLKFLFRLFFQFDSAGSHKVTIEKHQVPELMLIYGLGFLAIYLILVLLYLHAFKNRAKLELSEEEVFHTKTKMYAYSINVIIPAVAIICALIVDEKYAGSTGFIYFLFAPVFSLFYTIRGKKFRKQFGNTEINN